MEGRKNGWMEEKKEGRKEGGREGRMEGRTGGRERGIKGGRLNDINRRKKGIKSLMSRIERSDENYENCKILQAPLRKLTRKCKLDSRRASMKLQNYKNYENSGNLHDRKQLHKI